MTSVFAPKPTEKTTKDNEAGSTSSLPSLFSERHASAPLSLSSGPVASTGITSQPVSGVIGPRMAIKGDIEFEGELMIQGKVTGNIRSQEGSKSILRIDENAEVTGDVDVPVVKVSGTLKGNVSASELLHLHPTGTIVGPVKYNNIQLESGCTLEGSLTPEFKNGRK